MKILIELPTWLGDTVMMTPAFNNILNYYKNPRITIIGPPSSLGVLKTHPKIEKSIIINKSYSKFYHDARNLKKFDVFFSFRSSFRSKILKLLISSKEKYQFNKHKVRGHHQVEKYNNFINESLSINLVPENLLFDKALKKVANNSKPILGINPGASYGSSKRWYPIEFAKVAIELSKEYNILIFGGPNEVSFAKDIEDVLIQNNILNYQNLADATSISELIRYISNLDLFITGDSGPMHLASSYQIPTISIFGPTKDNETSQWMNKNSVIVKKTLDCQPCMQRVCPLGHHNCMKLIKSEDVLSAIKLITVN